MPTDLDSRRSLRQMTRDDLLAFPVWEWALNEEHGYGQGESLMRPTSLRCLPLTPAQYIVSAEATLSNGAVLPACVEVSVRSAKAKVAPMFMFLQDRHLDFDSAETRTVLGHYTRQDHAHPVSWTLAVPLEGAAKPPAGRLRRRLAVRLAEWWRRVRGVAPRDSLLAP
ncbi:MAG: hypothetical protein ACJ8GW_02140 [Massilia sp.]